MRSVTCCTISSVVAPGHSCLNHHGLDGEWRVLLAAEFAVLHEAGERDDQHEVDDEALVLERPTGQVEVLHLLILPLIKVCATRTF